MAGVQAVKRIKRTVYVWLCKCQRCGHAWESLAAEPPKYCAGCRRSNWQRAARSYRLKK